MSLPTCPKCGCQLEVKLIFASGPKSARFPVSNDDIGELLEQAELKSNPTKLEQDFLTSLRELYDRYGSATKVSDKQRELLERIANG